MAAGLTVAADKIDAAMARRGELLAKQGAAALGPRDLTLDGVPIERGSLAAAMVDDPMLHVLADREANAGALLDLIAAEELIAVQVRLVTVHRKEVEGEE